MEASPMEVTDWGLLDYRAATERQGALVERVLAGTAGDTLVLVEHPPVVTIGGQGKAGDVLMPEAFLEERGVEVCRTGRGGKVTYHGPGQMVAYPIIHLRNKDLHEYVRTLLETVMAVLAEFGLSPALKEGEPGVWVEGRKIASLGVAARRWVTYHGIALNVNTDLTPFSWIVPCGKPSEQMTSMKQELGRELDLPSVRECFTAHFMSRFGCGDRPDKGHPHWLRIPRRNVPAIDRMERMLSSRRIGTVCQSAHCPNLPECFARGTATFMILGGQCTRRCRFCAVGKGKPEPLDHEEPERVAGAAKLLGLRHVVVTSVTRDDLPDGGAAHFARTVYRIRDELPDSAIEILIPDFNGSPDLLETVFKSRPDVLNHNVETVPRLYLRVRPQAEYRRSLYVLEQASAYGLRVKSGLMLGLGESADELRRTLLDLRGAGCEYLTLGQYLAPSAAHEPVARYLSPFEFSEWAHEARSMGFKDVAAGPLVRSSYRADRMGKLQVSGTCGATISC